MVPKSTPIFLLISVILVIHFSGVSAYTDAELTNLYRGNTDTDTMNNIVNAINAGTLRCSDLPDNIIIVFCADSIAKFQQLQNNVTQILSPSKPTQDQQQPTSGSPASFNGLIPILMIVPVILIFITKMLLGGDSIGLPRIFLKHKVTKTENISHYSTGIKEDDAGVDLTSLDDHIDDEPISNNECFRKQQARILRHEETRSKPIPTTHKILFSFGLMKVKKK